LAIELVPASIAADFADANWKTRLAALEEMMVWLNDDSDVGAVKGLDSEVLVRFFAKRAWAEKNFQVFGNPAPRDRSDLLVQRFQRNCMPF
jgi:cytoskeleton-associated protein 5